MVQSSAPAIDDHEIITRTPSICVDYLSHNWTDEDVWSSWKAMTKRKNEIANGVRLENASWRTWAKQRGKLKTISPETLNWLKDSDVTWLYGPLHEHADPVPPPRQATARERLGLEDSARTKSILKHRTISEMLTTPGLNANSTAIEASGGQSGSGSSSRDGSDGEMESYGGRNARPPIKYTKSETALSEVGRVKSSGGSPPASVRLMLNLQGDGEKDDGIAHGHGVLEERRHISFNQRVDQCIAVDTIEDEEDDGDDDDDYSDEMYDTGRHDDDGSSSDEEVLTMKSSPRNAPAWPTMSHRSSSLSSYEHHTIAKLAPTMLKTSDTYPAPSPQVVDPTGFTAHFNGADGVAAAAGNADGRGPRVSSQPQMFQYDNQDDDVAQTRYSQWDADDDFNGDFDYFNGPDVHDSYQSQDGTAAGLESASDQADREAASAPPRSILKRRPIIDDSHEVNAAATHFSPPSSPEIAQTGSSGKERGRTSQRLGSSASYERIQDATRGSGVSSSGRTRSSSANGSIYDQGTVEASSSSSFGSTSSSPPPGAMGGERRGSFRGKAGDGSRAMGGNTRRGDADADSDGHASFDFNSPGYPASPQLDDKEGDDDSGDDAKLYGRQWADSRSASAGKGQARRGPPGKSGLANSRSFGSQEFDNGVTEELNDEPSARLSVDLENLPVNTRSPPGSAPGGPTPLNTPTFALARSRSTAGTGGGSSSSGKRSSRDSTGSGSGKGSAGAASTGVKNAAPTGHQATGSASSSSDDGQGYNEPPGSPLMPRRSSATGALVAPSHADKDAGVRVPLAHDYVEEDEGGIVGRAVEIVNTARDLIGALLGTGGDRGRSWREGN
jgi:hypothetical protein